MASTRRRDGASVDRHSDGGSFLLRCSVLSAPQQLWALLPWGLCWFKVGRSSSWSSSVLVRVSVAVKSHHDHGKSYKRKHWIRAGLEFRGLVRSHHGGELGSTQADTVLEKELRALHPDPRATGRGSKAHPQ